MMLDNMQSVVDVALEAGKKHRERLMALKDALQKDEPERALELAREVCGLKTKDEGRAA
jgi:hypothetical protein